MLVLEPADGLSLWANGPARQLLGAPGAAGELALDQAMPAVRRLRDLARAHLPAEGVRVELLFWTPSGPMRLVCHCRHAGTGARRDGLLIRLPGGGGAADHAVSPAAAGGEPPTSDAHWRPDDFSSTDLLQSRAAPVYCHAGLNDHERDLGIIAQIARQIGRGLERTNACEHHPAALVNGSAAHAACQCQPQQETGAGARAVSARAIALPQLARLIELVPVPMAVTRAQRIVYANQALLDRLGCPTLAQLLAAGECGGTGIQPAEFATGPGLVRLAVSDINGGATAGAGAAGSGEQNVGILLEAHELWQAADGGGLGLLVGAPAREQDCLEENHLAKASHEMRTPLSSIMGFAEVMRDERLGALGTPKYKGYAADIYESACHALSLVDDVLEQARARAESARAERGRAERGRAERAERVPRKAATRPPPRVPIDVAELVAACVASLQPVAAKAGVAVSAPPCSALPKLLADPRSVKQMLLNLLSNAIRATAPGGAAWAVAEWAPGGPLALLVQDTGAGMSAEEIEVALSPWGQVGPSARRRGGSGLGLPLTRELAEANGARLQIESVKGCGTTALLVFAKHCLLEP